MKPERYRPKDDFVLKQGKVTFPLKPYDIIHLEDGYLRVYNTLETQVYKFIHGDKLKYNKKTLELVKRKCHSLDEQFG